MRFTFKPRKILVQQRDRTRIHPVPAAILSVSSLHFPPIISCSSPQWQVFSLFLFTISTIIGLRSLTLPFLFLLTVLTTVIIFANEAMYTRRSILLRILITFSKQALFLYMLYTYTHTRTHIRVLGSRTRCNTAARERK